MGKDLSGKELGPGVYQRKDGSYCGRYFDRFNRRRCVYSVSIRELRRKLNAAIAEDKQLHSVRGSVTLDQWFETWIEVYKKNTVRPNTLKDYDRTYRRFISPKLGKMKITDIYKSHVQEIINGAHENGYGYEMQNKMRLVLNDICNRAIEDQFLVVNPVRGVRLKAKKEVKSDALSIEEQKEFFDFATFSFFYNAFQVQVNTGMRSGEMFALTEDDIDFDSKIIHISKTLVYEKYLGDKKKTFHIEDPKTRSSKRDIPVNSVCKEYLERQIRLKNIVAVKYPSDCQFLFVSSQNTPLEVTIYNDAINTVIRYMNLSRIREDEMKHFSGHTLRHTFATRCFEAGISPKVVQSYLGHATLQMTMDLYTHVMKEQAISDIERICESNTIIEKMTTSD